MFTQTKRFFLLILLIAALTMACNVEDFLIQSTATPTKITTLAVTPAPPTLTPIPIATMYQ